MVSYLWTFEVYKFKLTAVCVSNLLLQHVVNIPKILARAHNKGEWNLEVCLQNLFGMQLYVTTSVPASHTEFLQHKGVIVQRGLLSCFFVTQEAQCHSHALFHSFWTAKGGPILRMPLSFVSVLLPAPPELM